MQISPKAEFFKPQTMRNLTKSKGSESPEVVDAVRKSRQKWKAQLNRKTPLRPNQGGNLDITK